MKKLLGLFLTIFLLVFTLSSCSATVNFIEVEPLCLSEIDGKNYFLSIYTDENYQLDFESRIISSIQNDALPAFEEEVKTKNAFKYENFHGEYESVENEALEKHLKTFVLTEDESDLLVYVFGYWQEEILVGFVQVYNGYSRSCSGYDLANLDHSVLFAYDSTTDTFTVTEKIEDAAVVAFADETVIYWKNRAYYAYNLKTDTETYLVEDKAFDSGITNYATPYVYFNDDMCILHLIKNKQKEDKVFYYVFNFKTNEFSELKLNK